MKHTIYIYFSIICFTFIACQKESLPNEETPNVQGRKVYIANEGILQYGNSSISMYNIDNDSIYNNLYFKANQKPLGDIAMAIYADETQLYTVVNNSNKIVVLDKNTLVEKASIAIQQPRYIEFYAPKKAYVSSIYQPKVYVVDFEINQIVKEISVDFNRGTEGMLFHQNAMYVCNWDTACNYIYKINTTSHQIEERITIGGYAPKYILADKMNHLWVISGNAYFQKNDVFTQITTNGDILKTIPVAQNVDIISPIMDPEKEIIYYNAVDYSSSNNGVFKLPISSTQLAATPFIAASPLQYYYALGIDKDKKELYVGDPKGFNQIGDVHIHNFNGERLKSFSCGVAPSFFCFD